ncbi:protein phosphatase 2C domain-containing protein [uncultured Draconibacterium sp.]|uniref:PP2C family protein-serine/threonine phosphatase n=1 Tax=uncultured Draconibacterium sp. TaxID=1573823 RepID=UPI0025D5A46F|nr:protein phosphatase 2C domain-containing protein [uncultured Draconibacterium sp.]
MKVNYFTVKGRRKENEDYILSKSIEKDLSLHLIADGMGGYNNGRLAAETVANKIFDYLKNNKNKDSRIELIKESVVEANSAIKAIATDSGKSLGSTIGGCLINENSAIIFWVGDVKIIHVRDDKIQFESEDHSLINQLKKNGNIDNGLDLGSIRHVVTRSIKGEEDKFKPDVAEIELQLSDKLIICSDGILDISSLTDLSKINFNSKTKLENFKNKYENNSDNSSLIVLEF